MLDEIKIVHENFRRELSLGSHSTPDQGREARVTRYKEERKRNLHRGELGTHEQKDTCRGHLSDSTDSEAEEKRTRGSQDKLSYTEYKRRRRRRDVNRNLSILMSLVFDGRSLIAKAMGKHIQINYLLLILHEMALVIYFYVM